jgi:hypothetical protein
MQGLLEESKLSKHAYEESRQICCKEVTVLHRLSLTTSMENRMNLLLHLWQITLSVTQA